MECPWHDVRLRPVDYDFDTLDKEAIVVMGDGRDCVRRVTAQAIGQIKWHKPSILHVVLPDGQGMLARCRLVAWSIAKLANYVDYTYVYADRAWPIGRWLAARRDICLSAGGGRGPTGLTACGRRITVQRGARATIAILSPDKGVEWVHPIKAPQMMEEMEGSV